MQRYILTLSCVDHPGIVAAVSSVLARQGGNILEAHQFDDTETGRFFTRIVFQFVGRDNREGLDHTLAGLVPQHGFEYALRAVSDQKRVLILVSKFDHCLVDLLYRKRIGELPMKLCGIVSNHRMRRLRPIDIAASVLALERRTFF